ncbi:MAG: hypothetical protein WC959_01430 [Kiritimatiellales bacterium]
MHKLRAAYSKKVPLNEKYSTESFSASIERELPENLGQNELMEEFHSSFELTQSTVEGQIAAKKALASPSQKKGSEARSEAPAKITNKQVNFILRLGKKQGKVLADLNQVATEKFHVKSIYELTRKNASAMVEELQLAA